MANRRLPLADPSTPSTLGTAPIMVPTGMYDLTVGINGDCAVRVHNDNVDRIWYLVNEWLKQPRTQYIRVINGVGKQVFFWQKGA